jgi:hypothetical protein
MNERNLSEIPAAACTLVVGEFEVGDNGPDAKTAPVKLQARSGKPIEHWFWGRVVHDMAGMQLHKPRLPIDYVHDAKEVIGYLNKFEVEGGDLMTSGALVPWKDSDRATEIVHKMAAGVPYEASINFGGDGIKVQELDQGQVESVNGFEFEGPGIIVREWPLRGVAVCPYGADMNTETSALADTNKVFRGTVMAAPKAEAKESLMSESVESSVEVAAVETEVTEQATVETEATEAVELEQVEPAVEVAEVEDAPEELSREEFTRIADEFGAEIAVQTVKDGGDYNSALTAHAASLKAEVIELKAKIVELEADDGQPAVVTEVKEKAKLFRKDR